MDMSATTMGISLNADVDTKYNKDGHVQSKDFKGINMRVSVSGKINAPYHDMDLSLVEKKMTLQGNKIYSYVPTGDYIIQGGDVQTLMFNSYWNSKSIQGNFGRSYSLDFKFKGFYSNGGRAMSYPGIAGTPGFINYVNISLSVPFKIVLKFR